MRFIASSFLFFLILPFFIGLRLTQQANEQAHTNTISGEGLGRVHMDISCSPAVAAKFDRALALLHNFWYVRALESFQQVASNDPECAMA